jgi:hypothetical protein
MVANLPADSGADSVTISWSARTELAKDGKAACKNCVAIAYVGLAAPKQAKDFSAQIQVTPMSPGWANYKFRTVVTPELVNSIYVALGWNGIGSAIDVDCVTVTIVPIVK